MGRQLMIIEKEKHRNWLQFSNQLVIISLKSVESISELGQMDVNENVMQPIFCFTIEVYRGFDAGSFE